jgi:hypothetical protein
MVTVQQKVNCVSWLMDLKYSTCVQCMFQLAHGGSAPSYNFIMKWDRCLREAGNGLNEKSSGHPLKTRGTLDKHLYVAYARRFGQQAGIFPTPEFMKMYTNMFTYIQTAVARVHQTSQP